MWYKMLPLFSATVASIGLAGISTNIFNRIFLGTPYLRRLDTNEKIKLYYRDERISGVGNANKQIGLESI